MIPEKEIDEVTRASGSTIINQIAEALPTYISGAADLHCSNKNYIKGAGDFGTGFGKTYSGRDCYYGIMNGNSYGGIFTPPDAIFLVFADYMRAAMRIASLAELPVSYILTHDSIGVGEDGPTHQPVETVSGLCVFPNMDVMRPATCENSRMAYTYSMKRKSETPSKLNEFLAQLRMDGYAPPAGIRTDMGSEYYISSANTPAGDETPLSQFSTICKRHRIRHRVAPPNKSLHNDIEFVINLVGFADTLAPTNDDDNDFVDTGLHNHTTADTLAATTGHFSSSSHQQEIPNLTTADTLAATATSTRRETTPPKTPPRKQVQFAPSAKKTSAASASPEHARCVRRSAQLHGGTANVDINIGNPTALALIDGNGITPGEESFDTDNMAAAANSTDTLQAARLHGPLTETAVQRYHEQELRELRSKSIRPLRTAQIGHVEPRDVNDDDELYNPVMAMDSLRTRSAIATNKGYKMLSRDGIQHDDDELYNPVMTMDSLRTLSAIAAGKGYKMRQCDIPNAYLQGRLADRDGNPRYIYLHDPLTRKDVQGRKFYLKLLRPLHGLRQSGRFFGNELHGHLKDIGSTHPLSYINDTHPLSYINEFESSGTTSFVGPSSRYTWLPIGDHVHPPSHDTVARRTFRHDPTPHSSRPGRSPRHELLLRARDLPGSGEGRSTISPDDSPSPRGAITSPLSYNGRNKIKRLPANTELVVSPNNPKRTGSASHARYENYKHATTVGEYLQHGSRADLLWDFQHGLVTISGSAAMSAMFSPVLSLSACYGVSSVLALVNISGSAAMSVMFSPVLSLSACYGVSSILADAREESLSAYYGVSSVLAGAREGSFEISYDPLLSAYHTDNDLRDTGDPQFAATCVHLLRADVMASRAPDHRVSLSSFDLDNLDDTPGPSHAGTTAGSTWNQFCVHYPFHLASTVCAVGVTMGISATIIDNVIGLLSVRLTSKTDLLHNLLNKLHVTADLQGTDARFARLGHVDEPGPDALDASVLYSMISRPWKGLLPHG